MEVLDAETGPCSRTLTITVPPALVKEHLDRMYATAQQQIQIKGFRPGHVPRAVVEKKPGFKERTYHDALLSHGAPSMKVTRSLFAD